MTLQLIVLSFNAMTSLLFAFSSVCVCIWSRHWKKPVVRHYSLIIKPERELWVTGSWQLKLSRVVFPSITWLSKSWPSRTRSVEPSCQNCLNISIPGFSGQFVRSLELAAAKKSVQMTKEGNEELLWMIKWTWRNLSTSSIKMWLQRYDRWQHWEIFRSPLRYGVLCCASCLSVAIKLC